ncbi:hypothetical protein, partial [Streptomyces sp. NPDC051546]|uniref:hypothetical protein n=1 Tax=Streptomyces sp. NPDC051546 TaxID=3365655 RepID=UPI0037951D84
MNTTMPQPGCVAGGFSRSGCGDLGGAASLHGLDDVLVGCSEAAGWERGGAAGEGVPLLSTGVLNPYRSRAVRAGPGRHRNVAGDDTDLIGHRPAGPAFTWSVNGTD